eukprot:m.332219 g.332219  ORF g.332219 m.332219 type:complete len:180 (-) comp16899_c0_seq1:22-561(-)
MASLNQLVAVVVVALSLTATSFACVREISHLHAHCQLSVTVNTSCAAFALEASARMRGLNNWTDPHNGGTYSQVSANATYVQGSRLTNSQPQYKDDFDFMLTNSTPNTCTVTACSESEAYSYLDYSTNYCNLHNLYCGKAAGCTPVLYDFTSTETIKECLQHDTTQCIGIEIFFLQISQ